MEKEGLFFVLENFRQIALNERRISQIVRATIVALITSQTGTYSHLLKKSSWH